MKVEIEIIPSYSIAYIRHFGSYGTDNIQTMEQLKSWAKSNKLLDNKFIILGIAHDNPEITKPENCRYDTCFVISDDHSVNDNDVRKGSVAGGRYAVFTISHTAEAVQKAWEEIFVELFGQGYQFDETRPILERYKAEMVNNHYCEICVPVN